MSSVVKQVDNFSVFEDANGNREARSNLPVNRKLDLRFSPKEALEKEKRSKENVENWASELEETNEPWYEHFQESNQDSINKYENMLD